MIDGLKKTKLLLNAKFSNVGEWKTIVSSIGDIVEEAMFICNQDGITFRGLDPSHVSLLDITFPESSFNFFECNATFFGISISDFKNIISAASNEDVIELTIDSTSKMKISIKGELGMNFDLNLIEKSEVSTPLPKINVTSKITLSPAIFARIVSNIERVSEYITISTNQDKIRFLGSGYVGQAEVNLDKSNPDLIKLEIISDSTSEYSLEYMSKIIRNMGKASKNVNLEYGTQTPMHILFEMPSSTKVEYYLAPRIST